MGAGCIEGRRAEGGLTVVELLVTLVVASLVASSTFMFFAGQQRIYDAQTKILNVQQNLWAAMETLSRHVRAGGTGMVSCVRPDPDGAGADTGDPSPLGPAPSPLALPTNGPATGLRGFKSTASGSAVIRIPPLWIVNDANGDGPAGGADNDPDMLIVAFGNGTFGNFEDAKLGGNVANPAGDPILTLPSPPPPPAPPTTKYTDVFRPNEFVLLIDTASPPKSGNGDRGCTLFQITGIGVDELLRLSTGSIWNPPSDAAGAGMIPTPYEGGAGKSGAIRNFGQLNWVMFSIDDPDGAGTQPPRLTMIRLDEPSPTPAVLAEGVEDLQVVFGCDVLPTPQTADGILNEGAVGDAAGRRADEWIFNEPGDVVPAGCGKPAAIRLTLVARSLTADSTLEGTASSVRPQPEDFRADDPASDALRPFRRRVMSTTIFPRN